MNSLFSELMRRNVIRVAVAYLVASWLILQIGDVFIDFLELPDWSGKLMLIIMALGFPLALMFAWAFELTPEGLKAESEVEHTGASVTAKKLDVITIVMVIAALAILAADRIWFSQRIGSTVQQPVTTIAAAPLEASVAVLPFENISRDAANDPFTIGIHDDLLTQISKIGSLKTISRASVLQYRDRTKPLPQIASELGVATVLEGSVQRAGDQVRINVQLIDARSNEQLWAERYERQLSASNIFAIQSEIVKAIASSLQTKLSSDEQLAIEQVPTENLAALEFYFHGRQRMADRNSVALAEAVDYFSQAIELDPEFALAYVGLSESIQLQEDGGSLSRAEMFARATPALTRALELDNELGPAYNSLASLKWAEGNYLEAEAMFLKSIQLSPNYAMAYHWYGLMLVDLGRIEEGIDLYEAGIELDPLSPQFHESLGVALEFEGRFDKALTEYQKSNQVSKSFYSSYTYIGNIYWMVLGRLNKAVACHKKSIDLDPGSRLPQAYLGMLYLDMGDADRAEQWISRAMQLAPDSLETRAAMSLLDYYRGNQPEALQNALEVQKINPYYPDARLLQTMTMSLLRDYAISEGRPESALDAYAASYPELLESDDPVINLQNYRSAIDLAFLLQQVGKNKRAAMLLDRSLQLIRSGYISRLGFGGYGIADVHILALQEQPQPALAALRQAIDQGWRGLWWFYLKNNPNLSTLQDTAEFQTMTQEVESFMTSQRSTLSEADTCEEL